MGGQKRADRIPLNCARATELAGALAEQENTPTEKRVARSHDGFWRAFGNL